MSNLTTRLAKTTAIAAAFASASAIGSTAFAQECFLGEVKMVGFNFAPRGYALAHGQILPINQNQSLYSILGTTYGGDGRTTFALPDLRGRVPIGWGQGSALSNYSLGEKVGSETNTLTLANLPSHNHGATTTTTVHGYAARGNNGDPTGRALADSNRDDVYQNSAASVTLNAASVQNTTTVASTGGAAVNNLQPSQAINYIICLQGTFPSRN